MRYKVEYWENHRGEWLYDESFHKEEDAIAHADIEHKDTHLPHRVIEVRYEIG